MNETEKYLYRFIDSDITYQILPILNKYKVLKETRCGFWIELFPNSSIKKFVYKGTTRGFAKETIDDALESYYHRKRRQKMILSSQLDYVEDVLAEMATKELREGIVVTYKLEEIQSDTLITYHPNR